MTPAAHESFKANFYREKVDTESSNDNVHSKLYYVYNVCFILC